MDSARMVAVVVPSPATSDVLEATSRTSCAPIFSYGSSSSISFATVTPSLVIVGLPNFLSRITLRPLGPSVAFTAFASFSIPRSNVCRAFSSNCSCLAAIVYFSLLRLTDDAEDVVLAHDEIRLIVDFDFGAAVFRDQHLVAFLHREIDFLAVVIDFSSAESDDFALLRFFFRGIRDDDPAFLYFLLFNRLHQHPISERFYVNCHMFYFLLLLFVGLCRRPFLAKRPPANCFRYFFLSSSTTSNSASTTSPSPRLPASFSPPGRAPASGLGCGPACAPAPADACL